MRLAVAGEKPLQAQHVGMAGAADDDRPAGAAFQQPDAAQDQRPHDALAEIGLLHHQVAQPVRGNDEAFDRLEGLGIDQRRAGGKLRQLAHELPGPWVTIVSRRSSPPPCVTSTLPERTTIRPGATSPALTMRSPAA